jgi:hypothetical protein
VATLSYDFSVVGAQKVEAALASLERRFAQHSVRVNRMLTAPGPGGRSPAGAGAARSSGAMDADVRRQQNYWRQAQRGSAREREQAERRFQADQVRGIKRAETEGLRAGRRQAQIASQVRRADEQDHARSIRRAETEGARAGRRLAQTQIQHEREVHAARERFVGGTIGSGARRVMGGVAAVGQAGAAMLGVGGAALAATSLTQAISLDEQARRLSIQGRGEGQAGVNPDDLRKKFTQTGISSGISPESVAAGAAAYVQRTGDLTTAMANLDTFATTAQATGASIEDVSRAAADMSQKMDIKTVDDMRAALALLTIQGKRGAFELKDMAGQFPEMAATAANAGVRGVKGVRELGAIAQVAMQATGSGPEASTSVQAMFRQLQAKSADIQEGTAFSSGQKVNVFEGGDPTKPMRNFLDVIGDVMQASKGNIVELQEVFDVRGIRAVNPLIAAYRTANQGAGGGAKGDAAGRQAMQGVLGPFLSAPSNYGEIQRDAGDAMMSTSVQLEVLNTRLKDVIAGRLFPVLNELVQKFGDAVPVVANAISMLSSFASALAENPLSGLGAILGAAIAAEVAAAGLKSMLENAIAGSLGGLGSAGLILGSAVVAIQTASLFVKAMDKQADTNAARAAGQGETIREKARQELATTGKLSPETESQLKQLSATEQSTIAKGRDVTKEGLIKTLSRGANTVGNLVGLGGDENLQQGLTLAAAAGNKDYVQGAARTQELLNPETRQIIADILKDAASQAGEELKKKASEIGVTPNRGNSPSPVKPT